MLPVIPPIHLTVNIALDKETLNHQKRAGTDESDDYHKKKFKTMIYWDFVGIVIDLRMMSYRQLYLK